MKKHKSYKRKIDDTLYLPIHRSIMAKFNDNTHLFVYTPYTLLYKKRKSDIHPDPCRYPIDFTILNNYKDKF